VSRKPDSENLTLVRGQVGIAFANFNVVRSGELLPNVHKSRAFLGTAQLLLKAKISLAAGRTIVETITITAGRESARSRTKEKLIIY